MLAVLLLAISLVSCGGGSVALDTKLVDEDEGNAVKYFSRILKMDETARQNFVAAFRGYNVYKEGFNDAEVDPTKAVAVRSHPFSECGRNT